MSHVSILPRVSELTGEVSYDVRIVITADVVAGLDFAFRDAIVFRRDRQYLVISDKGDGVPSTWGRVSPLRGEVLVHALGPELLGLPAAPYRKVVVEAVGSGREITIALPDAFPEVNRRPMPVQCRTGEPLPFKAAMAIGTSRAARTRALDAYRSERPLHQVDGPAMVEFLESIGLAVEFVGPRLYRIAGKLLNLPDLYDLYRRKRGLRSVEAALVI